MTLEDYALRAQCGLFRRSGQSGAIKRWEVLEGQLSRSSVRRVCVSKRESADGQLQPEGKLERTDRSAGWNWSLP